ncbi:Putative GNAT domain, acyl-CoA N-acyltransferase [Colletotrichum destructivum]|uniref:GNAT domain, acyl-CoA N-acyltransferase n=1 Tax=Colletotrichum destructivum TaxID=34406 RepID=A0AAX4ISK5_9PEZI|nr:Putative GNAT domain, acyl-CoA N-acyltransferase [Colletotrichum destructivum]
MFIICPPSPSEAPSIASIHISSMSSNPLLPLQFPTPASLADLHLHLASNALDHLSRRPPHILVARAVDAVPMPALYPKVKAPSPSNTPDSGNGSGTVVASFAKWDIVRPHRHRNPPACPPSSPHPPPLLKPALGSQRLEPGRVSKGAWQELNGGDAPLWRQHHHQEAEEAEAEAKTEKEDGQNEKQREEEDEEEEWPASANREYLTAYSSAASTARREAMGSRPFLHLTFICTDLRFRGHGVGTLLMRAVTEVAKTEGLPVFLESTIDAVPFYEKLGFVRVGGFRMSIPVDGPPSPKEGFYEEVCMLLEQEST